MTAPTEGTATSPAPSEEGELPPLAPGGVVMRVHRVRTDLVVAACDSELLGTELSVGKGRAKVSSHFYGRILVSEEEFVSQVKRGTIVNLLGERTIAWAVAAGLLSHRAPMTLGGVPHAQIIDVTR